MYLLADVLSFCLLLPENIRPGVCHNKMHRKILVSLSDKGTSLLHIGSKIYSLLLIKHFKLLLPPLFQSREVDSNLQTFSLTNLMKIL